MKLSVDISKAVQVGRWEAVTAYPESRQAELDADAYGADGMMLRSLGARALRSGGVPWKEMVGLAGNTIPTAKDDPNYRDKVPTDISCCPEQVKAALRRIGRK